MKILWLSNKILSARDSATTGTWLDALSHELVNLGEIKLGNISQGNVREITKEDHGAIHQWVVPSNARLGRNGLPSSMITDALIGAVDEFSPDLVHTWGTENFWGLLTARKIISLPALLEMQGLKGAIARVFCGDLSFQEQLACIGIKEILRQSSSFQVRRQFETWGAFEKEIICGHRFISAHSEWIKAQVRAVNDGARIFRNERMIRDLFYKSPRWTFTGSPVIFCSAAYPSPFKGLHIAVRSIEILKKFNPGIQLRIAGPHQRPGIRREGYIAWINSEIHRLNLESNITWLGPLSAPQIVEELLNCSAFVLPTFVESYGVALAEAMLLGVPTVVSFTGGTSFLARDEETALFFPPGDVAMCAYQLGRLLNDRSLSERLSGWAQEVAETRNDPCQIVKQQVEIYHQVLADGSNQQRTVVSK